MPSPTTFFFFFFNDTATTEIYTLSLHDALPICDDAGRGGDRARDHAAGSAGLGRRVRALLQSPGAADRRARSEEHTSELQSPCNLVCRLLLEKKKKIPSRTAVAKRLAVRCLPLR